MNKKPYWAAGVAMLLLVPEGAHANCAQCGPPIAFGGEFMTHWTGCEKSLPQLSHTIWQIDMWGGEMASFGNAARFEYGDQNVWTSDVVEDAYPGGQDNAYADSVDFYALSSHGRVQGAAGHQTYIGSMCSRGTFTSPEWDSQNSIFDETPPNYFAINSPGYARFIMLLTCFSVDTEPQNAWQAATAYGNDVIMGYRGLSADSTNTEEVGRDLADGVFRNGQSFKPAWFYAVEDWWVDDVGEILVRGKTSAECISRLNGLSPQTPRRINGILGYMCWSSHQG